MNQSKDSTERRGEPEDPSKDANIRCERHSPEGESEDQQNDQSCPFKPTPCPGVDVWLTATNRTPPTFAKTQLQNGNPENVPSIKSANLSRTPRLPAREAIVIAKGQSLRAELVDAMNDE
jgi:hypothetical protein